MIDVQTHHRHQSISSPSDTSTVFYDALDLLSNTSLESCDEHETTPKHTNEASPTGSQHKKTPPQNRLAQWFDDDDANAFEEKCDIGHSDLTLCLPPPTPKSSNTTSTPPLPLTGVSPNSAFRRIGPRIDKVAMQTAWVGMGSSKKNAMSLPAMDHRTRTQQEVEKRSVSPSAHDQQSHGTASRDASRDEYEENDVINPVVSIHEVNICDDGSVDGYSSGEESGRFCAIVPSRSYNMASQSAADIYALEYAQSMEHQVLQLCSYSPISKCRLQHDEGQGSAREDNEVGNVLSKSPEKWLPSPLPGGDDKMRDAVSKTPKMSSLRRYKTWSPRSPPVDQSPLTRNSDRTTSSTDASSADQNDDYNPFLLEDVSKDSLRIDIAQTHDDEEIELAVHENLNGSSVSNGGSTVLDDYTPSSSEHSRQSRLRLRGAVTLPSPKRLFKEFSPKFISPIKLRGRSLSKDAAAQPVDALPKNVVMAQSGTNVGKAVAPADYDPLLLIGSITLAHAGPIWRMEFSPDGRYLATAGDDGLLSIYQVAPKKPKSTDLCPTAVALKEWEEAQGAPPPTDPRGIGPALGTDIEILSSKPLRRYGEHTADIVDLSWSRTGFLLTASLDKTVRLWHVSKKASLKTFAHASFVTSVSFHPTKDKYFVSGSFDRKVRVWDTPTGRVTEWAQAPDRISSVTFTPDEEYVVAGLFRGQVLFYTAEGLKYYTQVTARDRHGSKQSGAKVTGFSFRRMRKDVDGRERSPSCTSPTSTIKDDCDKEMPSSTKRRRRLNRKSMNLEDVRRQARKLKVSPKLIKSAFHRMKRRDRNALMFKEQILVSTNDSRLRLFGLDDYCQEKKYKGLKNTSLQIKARISESGQYIISGSDSGGLMHIWNASSRTRPLSIDSLGIHTSRGIEKSWASESFQVTNYQRKPIVTDAQFVPTNALKRAMKRSGLFQTISNQYDDLDHDLSSAAIITCDYEGSIRILLRKQVFDDAIKAAGPEGFH